MDEHAPGSELVGRLHPQRLETLGRLAASLAHDLRAPIASIVFNCEALRQGLPPPEASGVLDEIRSACTRLEVAIANFLDYSKIGPPQRAEISVADAAERALAVLRPLLEGRGEMFTLRLGDDAVAVGNVLVVEQLFVNLFQNALAAGAQRVELRSERREGCLEIRIADDGPGVPEELRERIFEPFFTTREDGVGLGLTTSREAARELGGDLVLAPSERGAVFVLRLPTREAP